MLREWRILVFSSYIFVVLAGFLETCGQEMTWEHAEDLELHGCRACRALDVDADANCPLSGYDCDSSLQMRTNVLSVNCECAQLRCVDGNAELAVGRAPFRRLLCADKQWQYNGTVAESGVCAKKCGLRICRTLADSNFKDDPTYEPFIVRKPDGNHPCAWGSCNNGALGVTGTDTQSYNGAVEFSCGGGRTWKGTNGERHDFIKCKRKIPCDEIKKWPADECSSTPTPDFVVECFDPKSSDTDNFVCPEGMLAIMLQPGMMVYQADEIKCDNSIGKWVYHLPIVEGGPRYMPQSELDKFVPLIYQKWSCQNLS